MRVKPMDLTMRETSHGEPASRTDVPLIVDELKAGVSLRHRTGVGRNPPAGHVQRMKGNAQLTLSRPASFPAGSSTARMGTAPDPRPSATR
jgi:hypothetical protein